MKLVEDKILNEGRIIGDDILKVDSFVNQQVDVKLAQQIGEYFASQFVNVDRVLSLEASGIVFGAFTAMALGNVPFAFARKSKSKTIDLNEVYISEVKSFTRGNVSTVFLNKNYIKKGEKVLIVDDFLAEGNGALCLIDLCNQAGAEVVGVCPVIEKYFQGGHEKLEKLGIKIVAGASIKRFENGKVIF